MDKKAPNNSFAPKSFTRMNDEHETGDFYFSGTFRTTKAVAAAVDPDEISRIFRNIMFIVNIRGGQHYLQVYKSENLTLYLVDNLSREAVLFYDHLPEDNFATLMLEEEYSEPT